MTKLALVEGAVLDIVLQATCPGCGTLAQTTYGDCQTDEPPALGSVFSCHPVAVCGCGDEKPDAEFRVVAYESGRIIPPDDRADAEVWS